MSKIEPAPFVPKQPIYGVEVIHAACHALEAVERIHREDDSITQKIVIQDIALRIIADGLLSHEIAIKGEP